MKQYLLSLNIFQLPPHVIASVVSAAEVPSQVVDQNIREPEHDG